jgi:hypothetical protein
MIMKQIFTRSRLIERLRDKIEEIDDSKLNVDEVWDLF